MRSGFAWEGRGEARLGPRLRPTATAESEPKAASSTEAGGSFIDRGRRQLHRLRPRATAAESEGSFIDCRWRRLSLSQRQLHRLRPRATAAESEGKRQLHRLEARGDGRIDGFFQGCIQGSRGRAKADLALDRASRGRGGVCGHGPALVSSKQRLSARGHGGPRLGPRPRRL
jgi:hypothetical protein